MDDKIEFKSTIIEIKGTRYMRVTPTLADHLDWITGTEITAIADKGKHGKFLAAWKTPTNKELIEKTIKKENE